MYECTVITASCILIYFYVIIVQPNNGRVYNHKFDEYLRSCGIQRRLTCERTPQKNEVAERRNRRLLEMAGCMIIHAKLPPSFVAETVATANYIRNRCPTQTLDSKIPYELWVDRRSRFDYFRNFGSTVVILDKNRSRDKLAA